MEKRNPNFEQPIKATWPNPKKVCCKDCIFRDKTVVDMYGEIKAVGVTRSTCDIYTRQNGTKPNAILFQNEKCRFYKKDKNYVDVNK